MYEKDILFGEKGETEFTNVSLQSLITMLKV